jgi:hypothetical protein
LLAKRSAAPKSCWLANHVSVPSWRGPVWARSAVCEPKSADPTADEARDDSDVTVVEAQSATLPHPRTQSSGAAVVDSETSLRNTGLCDRVAEGESLHIRTCSTVHVSRSGRVECRSSDGAVCLQVRPTGVRQTAQATPPTSRHPRRPEGRNAAGTDHRGTSRPASRRDARRFEAVRRRCGNSGTVMCARV